MTQFDSQEIRLQDWLLTVTDAVQSGDDDLDRLLGLSSAPSTGADDLFDLIRWLDMSLVEQEPSARFMARLKQDLMDEPEGVFTRLRRLPARVQIAAIVAVVAGVLLIVPRRLLNLGSGDKKATDIPALQP
jgi:hypothetical protein